MAEIEVTEINIEKNPEALPLHAELLGKALDLGIRLSQVDDEAPNDDPVILALKAETDALAVEIKERLSALSGTDSDGFKCMIILSPGKSSHVLEVRANVSVLTREQFQGKLMASHVAEQISKAMGLAGAPGFTRQGFYGDIIRDIVEQMGLGDDDEDETVEAVEGIGVEIEFVEEEDVEVEEYTEAEEYPRNADEG